MSKTGNLEKKIQFLRSSYPDILCKFSILLLFGFFILFLVKWFLTISIDGWLFKSRFCLYFIQKQIFLETPFESMFQWLPKMRCVNVICYARGLIFLFFTHMDQRSSSKPHKYLSEWEKSCFFRGIFTFWTPIQVRSNN